MVEEGATVAEIGVVVVTAVLSLDSRSRVGADLGAQVVLVGIKTRG